MTCPKCGKQVNDRTAFCPHCGVRVHTINRQPNRPTQRRPQTPPTTAPKPKPAFKMPALPKLSAFRGDKLQILCGVTALLSLVAMILWLNIGFSIEVGATTQDFSLYTYFFKQCHTTFLTVFVVLGLLSNIAFVLLYGFLNIPVMKPKTSLKIALQSVSVSNLLGMLSLHAALATSDHELLSYMNFAGWTCFLFMLASLVITALLFWQSRNNKA